MTVRVIPVAILALLATTLIVPSSAGAASNGGCSSTQKDYYGTFSVCLTANSNGSLTPTFVYHPNSAKGCTSIQLSVFNTKTVKTISLQSFACSRTGTVAGMPTASNEHGSFFAVVHGNTKGNYYDSPTLTR